MTAVHTESDIAIVGMAGRFPGARDIDEFWRNLTAGIESIARLSDQEILESGVPPSYLSNPSYVKADRKSTRLISSHSQISYAVFCLKKKKNTNSYISPTIHTHT